jgi:hypothetical protein
MGRTMREPPARAVAATMADRAGGLLEVLEPGQRDAATWPFPSDDERERWFYTPTDHGGLPLSEMTSEQHRMVWRLVASGLSVAGYHTTALIVGHENSLDRFEGFVTDFGRARGRDPLLYWIAIFGEVDPGGTWSWRFGGHHVSLHFTIVDGAVASTTPCFLGADPASVPLLGPHLLRPLGAVEDLARELARSLSPEQASGAVLSTAPPPDLIGVNRSRLRDGDHTLPLPLLWRGRFEAALDQRLARMQADLEASLGGDPDQLADLAFTSSPKGIAAGRLSHAQREILDELLLTYIGRIDDGLADVELARVRAIGDDLHFAWAGSVESGEPHYYRIQGGDLLVEYDNAQRGGNHVHTVWRDLARDFGRDPLAEHYARGRGH